jgi:inositol-pentakisphosphate 2-kinase
MQLLARFFEADESTNAAGLQKSFASALTQALIDSPVLPLLSTLQRTLDILDVEGLSTLYARTSPGLLSDGLGSSVPDPSVEEWEDFVKVYYSDYNSWDHASPSPEHLRHYLLAYLLSATFKDCSIIIRPRPQAPSISRDGPARSFDITIIDMDIKSMDRLGKWERLDRTLVEHYKGSAGQRRCIDSGLAHN